MRHANRSTFENDVEPGRLRRMHWLKGSLLIGTVVAGSMMACGTDDSAKASSVSRVSEADAGGGTAKRPWWEFGFTNGDLYNELTLSFLGKAWSQGADVGEVLETASRVDESDPKSWTREWRKTAERLGAVAQESESKNHPLSASQAYRRAATYYRAALHHYDDPASPANAAEIRELAQREVDAFGKFLKLSRAPCEVVQIPYEGTTLPAYYCKSPDAAAKAPVLLYMQGRDAWAEEGYAEAVEGLKRGFHVLMFDGPGQGQVLRLQGLPFRPDWEKVVTPIVDYVVARPEVDPAYVGLLALSMGGYLGPRAATKEHRLRVLIPNPGVLNWYALLEKNLNDLDPTLLPLLDTDEAAFNARVYGIMKANSFMKWGLEDYMWKMGVDTPAKFVRDQQRYMMTPAEVATITANTLVIGAEADDRGDPKALFDALTSQKDFLMFTAAETAQFHDQPGAEALRTQKTMEWLEGSLSKAP